MVSEVQYLSCCARLLIICYGPTFCSVELFFEKVFKQLNHTKSKTLRLNCLFCISACIDLLFLVRLTFLGSPPASLYMDRPSSLPKDHGGDRWMVTVTQLASISLCSWEVCNEFMMSWWIMVVLNNRSLWSFSSNSNTVIFPASYIKTIDAYIIDLILWSFFIPLHRCCHSMLC